MSDKVLRWRPPSLMHVDHQVDRAVKTIYDSVYNLEDKTVQGPEGTTGQRIAYGLTHVTGSALRVETGLSQVTSVVATIDAGSAAINEVVTAAVPTHFPGTINIFVWKPTASNDNTPVASTTERAIRWTVHGT